MAASHCFSSVTSRCRNVALPPAFSISATTAAPSLSSISATKTAFAPSRAKSLAVAAPMPLAAPVTSATLSFMRIGSSFGFLGELEPDDAGHDQAGRHHAHCRGLIAERHDTHDEGADRANAGPHRVGRAHRDEALCPQKQRAAGGHGADREEDPARPCAALAPAQFKPGWPADFANAPPNEIKPPHAPPPPPARLPPASPRR